MSQMRFFATRFVFSPSCHSCIGSIADVSMHVSDRLAGTPFMELFGIPADMFLVNYCLNFFSLSIAPRTSKIGPTLSSPSLASVSCYTKFIAPNFVATVVKELIYILIKMASSTLTLKHSGVLMHRTNNTKFISPIDQRKKGRVVNHHIVDGIWVCIYAMVY